MTFLNLSPYLVTAAVLSGALALLVRMIRSWTRGETSCSRCQSQGDVIRTDDVNPADLGLRDTGSVSRAATRYQSAACSSCHGCPSASSCVSASGKQPVESAPQRTGR